jgi:hypothetical protein
MRATPSSTLLGFFKESRYSREFEVETGSIQAASTTTHSLANGDFLLDDE